MDTRHTKLKHINVCQDIFGDVTRLLNIRHRVDLINVTQSDYHLMLQIDRTKNTCSFIKLFMHLHKLYPTTMKNIRILHSYYHCDVSLYQNIFNIISLMVTILSISSDINCFFCTISSILFLRLITWNVFTKLVKQLVTKLKSREQVIKDAMLLI